MVSGEVTVRINAQIHVPRSLPTPVLGALRRLAPFPNPVFHEKLRLRFAIFLSYTMLAASTHLVSSRLNSDPRV
jgi:hypothetical protein